MSEEDTTATRISTVWPVRACRRSPGPIGTMLGAFAIAELAASLLRPRQPPVAPTPLSPRTFFSGEQIARARAYRRPQLALGIAHGLSAATTLGWLTRRGCRSRSARPLGDAGAAVCLAAVLELVSLPFSAIGHHRARQVDLATQGWSDWATDELRSTAVTAALGAPIGAGLLALTRRCPDRWWAPGAAGAVGLAAAMTYAAPVALDPLFNRFTVLPAGPARSDVLELAARAGVDVGEVYVVDASRRTAAANAYVTGLRATKRVVLYDTLLERFSPAELRLVVAHELAHVRNRDIPRGLAFGAIVALPSTLAAQHLAQRLQGHGAPRRDRGEELALASIALAFGVVSALTGIAASRLSRAVERAADSFALRLTGEPEPFVAFERRIVRQNLADPAPPRWLTALLSSHPPTIERIGAAVTFARERGDRREAMLLGLDGAD